MTDPDDLESQILRRRVLQNDRRVREQGSTFSQFAQSEASEIGGRFAANERATVVGADPVPGYPAAFQQRDPVPDEPPLGYRIHDLTPHELEPSMASISLPVEEAQSTGDPAHAPSSPATSGAVSEQAGSSFFPTKSETGEEGC